MPTVNLTVRKVESLKPGAQTQTDYWDDSLPGFGLRVARTGRKTWVVMYRHNRRLRRLTLGTHPVLSLADARDRAKDALAAVADGHDPAADKIAARAAKTFSELCVEYMDRHAKPTKKTWREDQRIIDHDLLPRWKYAVPGEISRSDARALVEAVADRGAPIHANRVLALARKIFNFAIERDWLEHNPCHLVKRPGKEVARDRVLNDDEIRKVWAALDDEEPPIRALFRLQLLTAQRGGEVRTMRWTDVDLNAGWWTIPAELAKNGLSHRVPLSPQAVTILKDLRAWYDTRLPEINAARAKKHKDAKEPSDCVFPSRWHEGQPLTWTRKATKRVRDSSAVEFRPHDLRRTAASLMTGSGTSRVVVQKILNHVETGVTAVYDRHSSDRDKRVALDAWARTVAAILEGKSSSTVVQFNRP